MNENSDFCWEFKWNYGLEMRDVKKYLGYNYKLYNSIIRNRENFV